MTSEFYPALDHLVIACRTLDEGVAWCEATFGITPGPGGAHPMMGTHNRLLRLAGDAYPGAYLELIAINPEAQFPTPSRAVRWFDLDGPALQARLASDGPFLAHWVARVPDVDAARVKWLAMGYDPGPAIAASRDTPHGTLRWRITVRDDGKRLFDGCLPTLIQWDGEHPTARMPSSPLVLNKLCLQHPKAGELRAALTAIGLSTIADVREGEASLEAMWRTA